MAFVDACVEKLLNAAHAAGIAGRMTFLIVSDHGFNAYTRQIRANCVALRQASLGDKAYVLLEGGTAFVYLSGATEGPVITAMPQTGGSRGYLASDPDMNAIFIASGYRVRARGKLDPVSNLDIAPTLARLLGVKLPSAKGKAVAID